MLQKMMLSTLVFVAFLTAGCVSKRRLTTEAELWSLGLLYHSYANKSLDDCGPSGPDSLPEGAGFLVKDKELVPSLDSSEKAAFDAVKSGNIVVIWHVDFREVAKSPAGVAGTILAYEKNAPTSGGLVLMVDAAVQTMTAAEFQATPKATPKSK